MGMAEAFWIVFFKPIFGSLDKKSSKEKLLVGAIRVAFYILICGVTFAHGI
jgi:dipeptide/tripeptide permease